MMLRYWINPLFWLCVLRNWREGKRQRREWWAHHASCLDAGCPLCRTWLADE